MSTEFERWYQQARGDLVASIARAIADVDRAEDAVDEAFVRALEHWDTLAAHRSRTGWVYTVALNAARRTFRRHATERRVTALLVADDRAGATEPDGFADLVHGLPPRQGEALRLRHAEGLTESEIAVRMGVTRSTVSSTLRNAHRAVARRLRSPSEGEVMQLRLARVRRGGPDGCTVAYVDDDVTELVGYGAAVVDQIRIRRDDLVAVDTGTEPPEIVWRWWYGEIEAVADDVAQVRRRVAGPDGSAVKPVRLPDVLRSAAREAMPVWFGSDEGGGLVAVAVASRPDGARTQLPRVEEAYR